MGPNAERRSYLSIREVLDLLVEEFSDITISKIRFLESRGLIHPERTPSGYRKFFESDVERLRWILRQQRENFLPLKVIKGRLDGDAPGIDGVTAEQLFPSTVTRSSELGGRQSSMHGFGTTEHSRSGHSTVAVVDRATETVVEAPPVTVRPTKTIEQPIRNEVVISDETHTIVQRPPEETPSIERLEVESPQKDDARIIPPAEAVHQREVSKHRLASPSDETASYTVDELAKVSGADVALIVELQEFGLIEPHMVAGVMCFDDIAAEIVRCAVQFARFGLEPRHLNAMHHAAEREAGLYATVVTPLVRQRNPEARERATRDLDELTVLGGAWREAFIRAELRHLTGG